MLRHPKEGHSLLALIAPTPAFRSAHHVGGGPRSSSRFWVQLDQVGNVKRSALEESLRSEDARVETANAKVIIDHPPSSLTSNRIPMKETLDQPWRNDDRKFQRSVALASTTSSASQQGRVRRGRERSSSRVCLSEKTLTCSKDQPSSKIRTKRFNIVAEQIFRTRA